MANGREHRVGRRLAQPAQRRVLDHFAQFDQPLDVGLFAAALADAIEDLQHPLRADPAGHALAARLLLDEFEEEAGDVDHAAILIHDDQAAGAHDGAQFGERLVVQRHVQVLLGNAAAGRAADLGGLEGLAAGDAAADVVDQIAERHAHRHFDEARVFDRAGQGEDLSALAPFSALGGVPAAAAEDDRRDVGIGLDVVEHRGLAPETLLGREGRTGTRLAAIAFDRRQQRRLFAAHERPGAHADLDVEIEAGAEDVLAQQPALSRLGQGDLQSLDGQRIFGPDVDIAHLRPDRMAGDGHAFDARCADRLRARYGP